MNYSMNKLIWLLLAILLYSAPVMGEPIRRRQEAEAAEEIRKLEVQLKFFSEELEKVKVKRWQDKRNAITRKEAFSEAWDDIRREMDQLGQRKSQKESMLLRLDNQIAQQEAELKALEDRMKDFGIQLSEKAEEYIKLVRGGFPLDKGESEEIMRRVQADLEARGYRPQVDFIEALFIQQVKRFRAGETREVIRDRFALENVTPADPADAKTAAAAPKHPGVVAGYFVRIGCVYKAFISTESPDAAILARSGNLGDKPWMWLENIPTDKKEMLQNFRPAITAAFSDSVPLFLPIDVILRKATGAGFAAEEQGGLWDALVAEWIGSGFVIWFLLAIVSFSLLIVGQKLILVLVRGFGSKRAYNKVNKLWKEGKTEAALAYCQKSSNAVAQLLGVILEKASFDRKEAEDSAFARMLHLGPALERNINTINILAGAAPLVGLLGTVSGMINLFSAITMHGTNDPKMMAAGIAEALLSTKWGLIVALPLMLLYNMVQNMVQKVITDMEKYSASLLNTLYGPKKDA